MTLSPTRIEHSRPVRVSHIITDLATVGGAERMTVKLAQELPTHGVELEIVSLRDAGALGEEVLAFGGTVFALGLRHAAHLPKVVARLAAQIRRFDADVISTWLYHADLIGTIANCLAGRRPLVWNLRNSDMHLDQENSRTAFVRSLLVRLSHVPDLILSNSETGLKDHLAIGYRPRTTSVVPNGFDLKRYRSDIEHRRREREQLGLTEGDFVIGMAGRVAPMKDHHTFLQAARLAVLRHRTVRFVLAGVGTEPNSNLATAARQLGLGAHMQFLGFRPDMERVFNALDISTLSSSSGEGFPNVIGEAMACGLPCVATDVGDCRIIIADTGIVVPPNNPAALCEAWLRLVERGAEGRRLLGETARRRISDNFDLSSVARRYAEHYRNLAAARTLRNKI